MLRCARRSFPARPWRSSRRLGGALSHLWGSCRPGRSAKRGLRRTRAHRTRPLFASRAMQPLASREHRPRSRSTSGSPRGSAGSVEAIPRVTPGMSAITDLDPLMPPVDLTSVIPRRVGLCFPQDRALGTQEVTPRANAGAPPPSAPPWASLTQRLIPYPASDAPGQTRGRWNFSAQQPHAALGFPYRQYLPCTPRWALHPHDRR